RSGATTSAPVLTSLSKGTAVEVISESNGWSKVKASGKEGYVSTKYLTNSLTHNNHSDAKPATSTSSTQTTKYVSVTNGSLNMRSGATTSAPVLTSLSKGTAVEVISESNGWSKVKASGKEGYVSSKYLSDKGQTSSNTISTPAIVPRTTKYVSVTSGSLNMRVGASTGTTILTSLKSGTAVEVISETNGWSKIQVSGKEGYVSSKYLTAGVQSTTPSTNVPKPVTKYVSVTSGTLNVRTKPTTTASIMIKLAKDKEVKVLSDANGWSKVEVFGQVGYVSSQYLSNNKSSNLAPKPAESNKTETKYVLVSGNSVLNVRKAASTNSTILTKLPKNTQVLVMNDANGWAKIKVNQIVGYVSTQFLTSEGPSEKPVEPVQENKKEQMFVDVSLGSTLNMRNNASVASSIIVKLPRGLEVTVYSVKDGWASIEAYGKKGFVSTEFLSKSKPGSEIKVPEPTPELPESNEQPNVKDPITDTDKVNRKYVNVMHGSTLNMRESASTSASILTKLARGTIVTIISEENNWAKVSANGKTGFVSSQYLIATEPFNPGTSIADTEKIEEQFDITLDKLTEIQMAVKPQTDKKYNTYIREDALTLTSATTGTVKGNGWNVRGGAGTNHWVVGSVSKGQSLQIISKVTGADGYTWYQVNYNKSWVNASPEDVKYYLQPSNFLNTTVDSLQFLKLSLPANLNSEEVNTRILAGKGILDGKANAFIQAGDKYKVNEIYLISHALLETGNGTSTLAKGVVVNGRTVYNMYGIGAYDGSAVSSGAQYAYNAGWFTPEEAIIGGAKFIAQGYINSGQDTLYKMRWNPKSAVENGRASHQYATDIGWAAKQVKQIYNLYSLLDAYKLVLDIPKYK
ncbi:SH3 domain-containing protein, partial [Metabacillus malikii]